MRARVPDCLAAPWHAVAAWSIAAQAQQPGVLMLAEGDPEDILGIAAFLQLMHWINSRNLRIDAIYRAPF